MTIAQGSLVTLKTVVIKKRRFRKLGIFLQGQDIVTIVRSEHNDFQTNDIIFAINGRYTTNARDTSRYIWLHKYLSISFYR